jgi:haloalkane dehalogenase
MSNAQPFAQKKTAVVNGVKMAYIDEGEGDAIVFQHGDPTSSYEWRNVMPHLKGMGRLIACDLVGMGDSGKLANSGPDSYSYQEQREYLFALWDRLDLGDHVTFVVHDWGSVLGFDWAFQHQDRVAALAYLEAIVMPMSYSWTPPGLNAFYQRLRSPEGEELVLEKNLFVERFQFGSYRPELSEEEKDAYRAPYLEPGEGRRAQLSFVRQLPIDGEPADVVQIVEQYGKWLATSPIPKLFVNADPGGILIGPARDFCRTWPQQTEITVPGIHFLQENQADAIGTAVARLVRSLRSSS